MTSPRDLMAETNELRLENAILRSEIETLTSFAARLNSCRSQFPQAYATSAWLYAMVVMMVLALKEVVSLVRHGNPMWANERLNLYEYYSKFFPWYAKNAPGFVHEVSRASALLLYDASSLVTNLMDPIRWQQIFPSIIADVSMESRYQEFQMINVEFMPLISPLIQSRNVKLLRCCKHIENDTWVIADFSEYFTSYAQDSRPDFMRFPSGLLVQHITNGISKVTILDHWVYKEEEVVNRFNPNLGRRFGAQRWLDALERHCYDGLVMLNPSIGHHIQIFDPDFQANLLLLSTFMVYVFCTGVCGVAGQRWNQLGTAEFWVNNIRMFTREGRDTNGFPSIFVSAIGFARMEAKPEEIFGLIKFARKQDIWNCLQSIGDMREVIRIKRSRKPGNELSVFSMERIGSKEWYLIQETYFEASAAMIIHACIEAPSLAAVINGGDLSRVHILPCGFTIMPSGQEECVVSVGCQMKAGNAIVRSSDELMIYMENVITHTLCNVQNALPVRSGPP